MSDDDNAWNSDGINFFFVKIGKNGELIFNNEGRFDGSIEINFFLKNHVTSVLIQFHGWWNVNSFYTFNHSQF